MAVYAKRNAIIYIPQFCTNRRLFHSGYFVLVNNNLEPFLVVCVQLAALPPTFLTSKVVSSEYIGTPLAVLKHARDSTPKSMVYRSNTAFPVASFCSSP
jgi:hypothetical protein